MMTMVCVSKMQRVVKIKILFLCIYKRCVCALRQNRTQSETAEKIMYEFMMFFLCVIQFFRVCTFFHVKIKIALTRLLVVHS